MEAVDANFEYGGFARFANGRVDLFARFFHHLFDARGVDASVENQFLERDACHFAADRIESREDNCFRCVVDDEVNARRGLQRADVASFATDDATFHVVVGQGYDGDRRFRHMVCGAALNRERNDVSRALVRFFLGLGLDVANEDRGFVPCVPLYVGKQHVAGVFHGETRYLFQLVELLIV